MCWDRKPRVRPRALLDVVCTSRYSFSAAAPRGDRHLQRGRRNNHGSSSGSEFPARRAWFAKQSVVPRYGAEPCSPVCAEERRGSGQPRPAAPTGRVLDVTRELVVVQSGEPKAIRGNARALHPFHSMDTHVQAHIPVWQSSRLQAGTDVCFPSGTV